MDFLRSHQTCFGWIARVGQHGNTWGDSKDGRGCLLSRLCPPKGFRKIYNLTSLFVYPLLYEGFGLPPPEAMACGCPVVVSKATRLPEVCGNAAYYVNPKETTSIAKGMSKVLSDEELRAFQIKRGIAHAKHFRWE